MTSYTSVDYGTVQSKTYTLYINSNDKLSGTANNSPTFNINWNDFLPIEFALYKVVFSFQSIGGYYVDPSGRATVYSGARVVADFAGRSFTFDSSTSSPSLTLGYIQRDIQVSGGGANTLSAFYLMNPPKTILRPNQNNFSMKIYNIYSGALFTDTNNLGVATSDMSAWNIIMEFIPIESSRISSVRTIGL